MGKDRKFDATVMTVPLDELQVFCGGNVEVVEFHARQLGVEGVTDWAGRRAFTADDARRIVMAFRTSRDKHESDWEAFQADIRNHKEQVRQAREAELAQKRAAVTEANTAARRRWAERALKAREAEFAREAAAETAKRGPSFTEWKITHGGAP